MEELVVDLAPWTQQWTASRTEVRRNSLTSLVVGLSLLLLAVAGSAARIATVGVRWELVGAVLIAGVGVLLVRNGVRYRRGLQRDASDPIRFAAPYAFRIADDMIHFPGAFTSLPESWPLQETRVISTPGYLELRAPGRRTRRFPAKSFLLPTAAIRTAVETYRGGGFPQP